AASLAALSAAFRLATHAGCDVSCVAWSPPVIDTGYVATTSVWLYDPSPALMRTSSTCAPGSNRKNQPNASPLPAGWTRDGLLPAFAGSPWKYGRAQMCTGWSLV